MFPSRRLGVLSIVLVVAVVAGVGLDRWIGLPIAWRWTQTGGQFVGAPPPTSVPYPVSANRPDVRLAAAGDVGTGGSAEYATADAMAALEETAEFDALLLLGDNVYPSGEPEGVQSAVLDPFAAVLDGPTELVAALGNHDVRTGDGVPQLAALGLPGRWYVKRFGAVAVVVVDSTRPQDPDQLRWLDATLASCTAPWVVVMQHHPPNSAGYHGSDVASRENLVPLYVRHSVDLVLAGHDHDYQRSEQIDGVTYVVSGGAATLRPTGREPFTVTAASSYHFVELAATADQLVVRAVRQNGRVFDEFSLPASDRAASLDEDGCR